MRGFQIIQQLLRTIWRAGGAQGKRRASMALIAAVSLVAGATMESVRAQNSALQSEPLVAAASRQIGIVRCLPAIGAVSRRATLAATRQDILMDWDRTRPDIGPIFATTAMSERAGSALFTISAAPTPEGGCSLLAERISVAREACPAFLKTALAGYVGGPLIPGVDVYYHPSRPGETFTLVPAGANCLVVRRQPIFNTTPAQ